jgi:SAM-dependent methyltransferase
MLEIGAGIGTFSSYLLASGADPLVLVEPDAACAAELRHAFGADPRVEIAEESVPESAAVRARSASFAYALCQNVLEHIEDDRAALAAVVDSLRPGGEVAVLVPAHPRLYGRVDARFGHHRRYTRTMLRELVEGAGAELTSLRSFNLLGVPGWWVAGRSRLIDVDAASLRLYEALVRVWRPVEEVLHPPFGLSLVARARRATP